MSSEKQGFSDFIGNNRASVFLHGTIARDTTAHGYLFLGPASVGKRTLLGFYLAKLLNQEWSPEKDLTAFQSYPDFTLVRRGLDEKTGKHRKNITVEQIRLLRQRLSMGTFLSSWKVAVIDGAEHLSAGANNALLKTLEEPTPKTVIVLVADTVAQIPETVLSRLQIIRFSRVPRLSIRDALVERGHNREEADELAGRARGCPGIAIVLAKDAELRADSDLRITRAVSLLNKPVYERFSAVDEVLPKRADLVVQSSVAHTFLTDIQLVLSDALSIALGEPGRVHLHKEREVISQYAKERSPKMIAKQLKKIDELIMDLSRNINPKLILESFVLSL